MTLRAALLREAAISAVINGGLSLAFFLLLFGYRHAPDIQALARDFVPQAFIVSLMGSIVPALLLRRSVGGAVRPIVMRAVTLACAGAVIAGGGAYALAEMHSDIAIATVHAIAIKVAFGAVLGALVTPAALLPLLRPEHKR